MAVRLLVGRAVLSERGTPGKPRTWALPTHTTVVTAYDAAEAVIQAQRERLDLIVLDILMPEGGGFAVLDRLATSAETRAVPIIVLTGSDEPAIEAWARAAGVRHFLRKPVEGAVLLDAVRAAIGESG